MTVYCVWIRSFRSTRCGKADLGDHLDRSLEVFFIEESKMLKWLKGLPSSYLLGWIGVGLLGIVIVLVFVRRLVGMDG